MNDPVTIVLAGPPGEGPDLLRAALLGNRKPLRRRGVDIGRMADAAGPMAEEAARRVLVLTAPALPRLIGLRDRLRAGARAIVYVEPRQAALLARVERSLLAGQSLERQFRQPKPLGYRAALERYEQAFGGENVDFRVAGPAHLPGPMIIEDFWRAARLPGDAAALGLGGLLPRRRLSLEAALTLDRLIIHHASRIDRKRHPRVAAAVLRSVSRLAGRPLALPRAHAAAVIEASRADIDWLEARVGEAALAEPRPRFLEPAWAMDPATAESVASFILRAARQSAELRGLRAQARAEAG